MAEALGEVRRQRIRNIETVEAEILAVQKRKLKENGRTLLLG